MERFVQAIVAGGIALVAGLWIVEFFEPASGPWLLGIVFVSLGIVGLAAGIRHEVEY